jgi:hypothetical protein
MDDGGRCGRVLGLLMKQVDGFVFVWPDRKDLMDDSGRCGIVSGLDQDFETGHLRMSSDMDHTPADQVALANRL